MTGGEYLRFMREKLGLTIRDVEAATNQIASRHGTLEYSVSLSRLSDIETKGIVPNLHKLYSLSVVYRKDIRDLMLAFGIDVANSAEDIDVIRPPNTHPIEVLKSIRAAEMPVRLDPSFDYRTTNVLRRMVLNWGTVPFSVLRKFTDRAYSYAYVGANDFTMYPLLLPGAFVQIDESKTKILKRAWRSEFERPIYFVETRDRYVCAWCEVNGGMLTLQPHPMSPERTRIVPLGRDAEIIGQVVGIAMRIEQWMSAGEIEPASRVREG